MLEWGSLTDVISDSNTVNREIIYIIIYLLYFVPMWTCPFEAFGVVFVDFQIRNY